MKGQPVQFVTEIPIRFGETDPAGVVYYPHFFHYYHCAFEEFFGSCHGTNYATWTQTNQVGFPTRRIESDFSEPLRYGDTARISVSIPRIGDRSLDFQFSLNTTDGRAVSSALIGKVCVDMTTFKSCTIPDELRVVFERYHGEIV